MDYNKLAELLFPQITKTTEEIEADFPARELPEGAKVTRLGPSPTGFIHLEIFMGPLLTSVWHTRAAAFFISESRIPTTKDMWKARWRRLSIR